MQSARQKMQNAEWKSRWKHFVIGVIAGTFQEEQTASGGLCTAKLQDIEGVLPSANLDVIDGCENVLYAVFVDGALHVGFSGSRALPRHALNRGTRSQRIRRRSGGAFWPGASLDPPAAATNVCHPGQACPGTSSAGKPGSSAPSAVNHWGTDVTSQPSGLWSGSAAQQVCDRAVDPGSSPG